VIALNAIAPGLRCSVPKALIFSLSARVSTAPDLIFLKNLIFLKKKLMVFIQVSFKHAIFERFL
jgi:hypothetical protein